MPTIEMQPQLRVSASGALVPPAKTESTSDAVQLEWPVLMLYGGRLDWRLRTARPFPVRIYKENDTYVVQCEEIEQFGYGSDMSEALDDFGKTVSEMYFYLADESGNLTDSMSERFSVLSRFIEHLDMKSKTA